MPQNREKPAPPNRPGVQPVFRSNHAFGEGEKKGSGFSQPDMGRKRARALGSSDSSFLEIGSKHSSLPVCGTKKVRVDRLGKPERCAEGSESSTLDRGMSRSREPQRSFERRSRHRTRKDLYGPKPPNQKRKTRSGGETKQASTRRSGRRPSNALHQSFASETISKERLTVCNPFYSAVFRIKSAMF